MGLSEADLTADPQGVSQTERVLLALFPHVNVLVDALSHLKNKPVC